jgi:hypothetical protein
MKVVPTPLLEKKRAAAAEPPIPITRVKRETKVVANDLVKFELQGAPTALRKRLCFGRET